MSIQLKMGLKLTQKLKMTPQLQQSIKLLSLPLMEVEKVVREELLENPVLEEVQETIEERSAEEESNKEQSMAFESSWMEYTDSISSGVPYQSRQGRTASGTFNFENVVSTERNLHEHLAWQVQMSGFSNKEKAHLNLLLDAINEEGYLTTSLEQIAQEEDIELSELEQALELLHTLDPYGVGARDLKECLLIQAKQNQEDTKDLVTLITNYLPDLQGKNYAFIAQKMGLQEEEILDLHRIITTMDPKPGSLFTTQPTQYITPDVFVSPSEEGYRVSLNQEGLPHLRVTSTYQNMLRRLNDNKKVQLEGSTHKYLRHKMNSALWLIRSLNQRQRTLFQVTTAIVHHQKSFFDKGPIGMKPLILQQIAEEVGVHTSTVSRVTTNKYVHTPYGIYELKYFFNVGVETDSGEKLSGEVLKLKIKSYVKNEDKKNPLSDQCIVDRLREEVGVHLARRTIAKYRDTLKILPANQRKESESHS